MGMRSLAGPDPITVEHYTFQHGSIVLKVSTPLTAFDLTFSLLGSHSIRMVPQYPHIHTTSNS